MTQAGKGGPIVRVALSPSDRLTGAGKRRQAQRGEPHARHIHRHDNGDTSRKGCRGRCDVGHIGQRNRPAFFLVAVNVEAYGMRRCIACHASQGNRGKAKSQECLASPRGVAKQPRGNDIRRGSARVQVALPDHRFTGPSRSIGRRLDDREERASGDIECYRPGSRRREIHVERHPGIHRSHIAAGGDAGSCQELTNSGRSAGVVDGHASCGGRAAGEGVCRCSQGGDRRNAKGIGRARGDLNDDRTWG